MLGLAAVGPVLEVVGVARRGGGVAAAVHAAAVAGVDGPAEPAGDDPRAGVQRDQRPSSS